jgi:hypothetical protein
VKAKKRMLPVEWTDVVIEDLPVVPAPTALEALALKRLVHFMQRGNHNHATRSAANGPRRMVQVLEQIS